MLDIVYAVAMVATMVCGFGVMGMAVYCAAKLGDAVEKFLLHQNDDEPETINLHLAYSEDGIAFYDYE